MYDMAMEKQDELGALWLKTSGAGMKFMGGKITIGDRTEEVVVFKNQYKEQGDNKPDYRVYRSKPREGAPPPNRDWAKELSDDIPF
jgi:uncharacterized protein (DUF736 family)